MVCWSFTSQAKHETTCKNHDDSVEYNLKLARTENVPTDTIHIAFTFVLYWGPVLCPLLPVSYGEAFFGYTVLSLLNSAVKIRTYNILEITEDISPGWVSKRRIRLVCQ